MKKYTLNGFEKYFLDFQDAQKEANRLNRKGEIPLGFESEEEVEAYRTGHWEEYFKDTYRPVETDAEAVVYADGSFDAKTGKGGYGIVIFFSDGEIFCESGLLEDMEPETYRVTRFDRCGQQYGEPVYRTYVDLFKGKDVPEQKHTFVLASRQDGGEAESVIRSLEICVKERGLKKIILAYDCEFVDSRYHNGRKGAKFNVPYAYGAFCEDLREEYNPDVKFVKVDSHTDNKGKGQYLVAESTFTHAVYNDIVDAMAKAEMKGNPINRSENFNMVRVMPEEFKTFKEIEDASPIGQRQQARRAHARHLFEIVAYNKKIRPVFMK